MNRPIAIQRLYHQQIESSHCRSPQEVVAWLGAVQAQDFPAAKWALGLRLPGSADADIEAALAARRIVRSWVPRGTLHFVAAADLRWMLELLGERIRAGFARRLKQLDLGAATLDRSRAVIAAQLGGGRTQTRPELAALLEQNGISTQGQRLPYLLSHAALTGAVCQCGVQDREPLYLALDDLPPAEPPGDRDAARIELARRYFTSRGPATVQDFANWSGLPAAEAREGLEANRNALAAEKSGGREYWRAGELSSIPEAGPRVHLLPSFDELMIGYKDHRPVLDTSISVLGDLRNWVSPVLAIDGRVAGLWQRTVKKTTLHIQPQPFRPLSAAEKDALHAAARRYAEFLGLEADVILPAPD